MERIYHYSISLHTENPPNTNLIKAHEKNAVFIGHDFKPTIDENHLMVGTMALAEAVIQLLLEPMKEKFGPKTTLGVEYCSVLATEKQKGRIVEHKAIVEEFLAKK
jgi:hypothetical protein